MTIRCGCWIMIRLVSFPYLSLVVSVSGLVLPKEQVLRCRVTRNTKYADLLALHASCASLHIATRS